MNLGQKHKKILDRQAWLWSQTVLAEWKKVRNNTWGKYDVKYEDQLRLLTLRVWMHKYKVSLNFIMSTLITYYIKGREKTHKVKKNTLGVTFSTLTGDASEQILKDAITRTYPNRENIAYWKSKEQERYLERSHIQNIDTTTVKDFVQQYKVQVKKSRAEIEKILSTDVFKKRRYPNNPWI